MMIDRERETRADQSGSRLADGHRLPVARGIPYGNPRISPNRPLSARKFACYMWDASLSFTASLQGRLRGRKPCPPQ